MAVELLRSQVQYLKAENAARKSGRQGPPRLITQRQSYHDLEALLWVLVYAMMIFNYNSLTKGADRKEYKQILDEYFGHGSATTTLLKRHAMLSLVLSQGGEDQASEWFADLHERRFFIRCMTLIAKHNRAEEEEEDCGAFEGEISDDNPLWDSADDESDDNPDRNALAESGTYVRRHSTKAAQKPGSGLRKHSPVITYESVVGILKKSIDELR